MKYDYVLLYHPKLNSLHIVIAGAGHYIRSMRRGGWRLVGDL